MLQAKAALHWPEGLLGSARKLPWLNAPSTVAKLLSPGGRERKRPRESLCYRKVGSRCENVPKAVCSTIRDAQVCEPITQLLDMLLNSGLTIIPSLLCQLALSRCLRPVLQAPDTRERNLSSICTYYPIPCSCKYLGPERVCYGIFLNCG